MAPKKLNFKKRLKQHFDDEVVSIMSLEVHTLMLTIKPRWKFPLTKEGEHNYDAYVMKKLSTVIRKYCHGKA